MRMRNALRDLQIARRALALVEEWIAKAERSLTDEDHSPQSAKTRRQRAPWTSDKERGSNGVPTR